MAETKFNDSFQKLLDEVKEQNKFDKTTGILQYLKIREVAGEDDDKREEQLNAVAEKLDRVKEAITGIEFDFTIDPMLTMMENQQEILQKSLEELSLIRKISEGSLKYDKSMKAYVNTSGKQIKNEVTGKISKDGQALDYETARDFMSTAPQRVKDDPSKQLNIKKVERPEVKKGATVSKQDRKEKPVVQPEKPLTLGQAVKEYFGGMGEGLKEGSQFIFGEGPDLSKEGLKEKVGSIKQGAANIKDKALAAKEKTKDIFGKVKSFMSKDNKGYEIGKAAGNTFSSIKEKFKEKYSNIKENTKEILSAPAGYEKPETADVAKQADVTPVQKDSKAAEVQQEKLDAAQEKINIQAKEFEKKIEEKPKVELDYTEKFDETIKVLKENNEKFSKEFKDFVKVYKDKMDELIEKVGEGATGSGGGFDLPSFGKNAGNLAKGAGTAAAGSAAMTAATIGTVAVGGAAATGLATGILATEAQKSNRKALQENSMLGAASGDTAVAGAILDANGPDTAEKVKQRQGAEKVALKDAPWYTKAYGIGKDKYLKEQGYSQDQIDEMTGKNSVADLKAKKEEMETSLGSRKYMNEEDQKKYDDLTKQIDEKEKRQADKTLGLKPGETVQPFTNKVEPTGTIPTAAATTNLTNENKDLTREAATPSSNVVVNNVNNTTGGNQGPQIVPIRNQPRNDNSTFERQMERVAFY